MPLIAGKGLGGHESKSVLCRLGLGYVFRIEVAAEYPDM
jgi:hypothetical protein